REQRLGLLHVETAAAYLLEAGIARARTALVKLTDELHFVVVNPVDPSERQHRPGQRFHLLEAQVLLQKELSSHAPPLASLLRPRKSARIQCRSLWPRSTWNRRPGRATMASMDDRAGAALADGPISPAPSKE